MVPSTGNARHSVHLPAPITIDDIFDPSPSGCVRGLPPWTAALPVMHRGVENRHHKGCTLFTPRPKSSPLPRFSMAHNPQKTLPQRRRRTDLASMTVALPCPRPSSGSTAYVPDEGFETKRRGVVAADSFRVGAGCARSQERTSVRLRAASLPRVMRLGKPGLATAVDVREPSTVGERALAT